MKYTITLFAFLFSPFLQKVTACDCFYIPTFCQAITYENNGEIRDYLHIYHVTVAVKQTDGMSVNIHQTFFGENLAGQSIFISSGDGANCNLITSQFEVGESLVIAAAKSIDNWYMSECYVSFLKVENGMVSGAIAEGVTNVPLAEFHTLANCGDLQLNPISEPNIPDYISLTPTLTDGTVILKSLIQLPADLHLQVFDVAGRQIFQTTIRNNGALVEETIHMRDWASGLYLFQAAVAGQKEVYKVVKVRP